MRNYHTEEIPIYAQIGNFLVGKRFKGTVKRGTPEQEYMVTSYHIIGNAEGLDLEVETSDHQSHRISLITHLSDVSTEAFGLVV